MLREVIRESYSMSFKANGGGCNYAQRLVQATRGYVSYNDPVTDAPDFKIVGNVLSINAKLRMKQECRPMGRSRLEVDFDYLKGTDQEDIGAIREIMAGVGLERVVD
ncbi:hypothetical protein CMI42_02705 [Candidatus Pacearchaeota archaeon]|nr:hypothetical protein [Candidatus Pacearchaeota archaeon]|tara:strand:- start:1387 stop:1707 length:321 start_codon:yes stop_codon:yes gene_type:complete